jgi:hypothetical protein
MTKWAGTPPEGPVSVFTVTNVNAANQICGLLELQVGEVTQHRETCRCSVGVDGRKTIESKSSRRDRGWTPGSLSGFVGERIHCWGREGFNWIL